MRQSSAPARGRFDSILLLRWCGLAVVAAVVGRLKKWDELELA
jgi:hypothetical protein